MKERKNLDFNALTGLITLLLGLIYGIKAYTLPRATIGSPMAPSIYPLILAGVLVVLGGVLLVRSNFKMTMESFKILKEQAGKNDRLSWKMIGITCVISLVYGIIFDHLGYVISTFIFIQVILAITNGKEKWKTNTTVSVFFSIGVYVIFSKLLGVSLPPLPYFYF
ncbi:tripartite tricarboxylate transporter TctB family protein [Wukongibacter baidiensis]|uniref:tripartite tricarboxylate transporter TctB family protein n=1 Tax=Wukongibacter baidiensis TaxID=1723361 RepID=UPI003D7FBA82